MRKICYLNLLALFALFIGCKKDGEDVLETPSVAAPNATNFQNLRKAALEELTKTKEFVVDGNGSIEFTSEKGVKVSIPEGCLTIEGKTVSGTVKVDFIELFDKASLLTTNIATMGRDLTDGNVKFLVTGGAFYVNVTQNGKPVDEINYCGYTLDVPANLTGGVDQDMKLWYGNFDEKGNLIWDEVVQNPEWDGPVDEGGNPVDGWDNPIAWVSLTVNKGMYNAIFDKFGWVNIDVFPNYNYEGTSISVTTSSEYNGENSAVFVSYPGVAGLAAIYYYEQRKFFYTGPYKLEIGSKIDLIFTSESNGKWAYAIKSVTVTKDLDVGFSKSDLKEATKEELELAISKLK